MKELHDKTSIGDITEFLTIFHPPALQDVTVQFRVVDKNIVYAPRKNDDDYIDACLDFEAALSKFPRHQLSLLGSSKLLAKKHLWMQELRRLFPALRDSNRLAIGCESSERFGYKNSIV